MEIKPLGDGAVLINFEQAIDISIHKKVIQMASGIKNLKNPVIVDIVPAYCSLAIFYDATKSSFKLIKESIGSIKEGLSSPPEDRYLWEIPVCYEETFAPDLKACSNVLKLSQNEIINRHTLIDYEIYMLGFVPGFIYLGSLDESLSIPRKATPVLNVPPGSIAIGGIQTGIYSLSSPAGWHVIGRTPCTIFDPKQKDIISLKPGDQVRFTPITSEVYKDIHNKSPEIITYRKQQL